MARAHPRLKQAGDLVVVDQLVSPTPRLIAHAMWLGYAYLQWMTSVESKASLDRYACVVIGAVDRVASAHLVDEE